MAEDPPETPNYGFPLMSGATDDYVDLWHLILEDGAGTETNNDGLIEPLDAILDGIEADVSTLDMEKVDSAGARSAVDGSSVSITGSSGSISGDNVTTVNGKTGDVTIETPEETQSSGAFGGYSTLIDAEETRSDDSDQLYTDSWTYDETFTDEYVVYVDEDTDIVVEELEYRVVKEDGTKTWTTFFDGSHDVNGDWEYTEMIDGGIVVDGLRITHYNPPDGFLGIAYVTNTVHTVGMLDHSHQI